MECFLVPLQGLEFGAKGERSGKCMRKARVMAEIRPDSTAAVHAKFTEHYVSLLKNSLLRKNKSRDIKLGRKRRVVTCGQIINWELTVTVEIMPANERKGIIKIYSENSWLSCLSGLEKMLGGLENVALAVSMEIYTEALTEDHCLIHVTWSSPDLKMQVIEVPGGEPTTGFIGSVTFTDELLKLWTGSTARFAGNLSIKAKLDDKALDIIRLDNLSAPLKFYKKMLTDAVLADATIVAGNGTPVKCHRAVLSAQSPVFQAMFESSMEEGVTGIVKIPDMTEPGVQALLAYLYCWELKEASKSSSISYQLLVAADKYMITSLQEEILELILSKALPWFSIDSTLDLHKFARNKVENEKNAKYKDLEEKTVAVLKSKPSQELIGCAQYQEIFREPKSGMNFCTYLLEKLNGNCKSDDDDGDNE